MQKLPGLKGNKHFNKGDSFVIDLHDMHFLLQGKPITMNI